MLRKRGSDGVNRSIGINNNDEAVVFDGSWRKIYHENFKPSASDVGALPLSGGTLTSNLTISNGTNFQCLEVRRGNVKARFGNGLTAATITCIEDGEEIGVLTIKDTIRVKEKGDSTYHRVYHEGFKPSVPALMPVGMCAMFPSTSLPPDWVLADGRSTSGMPQAIIDLYGPNLPDMRDEFSRGWGGDRDPLSKQSEDIKSHGHSASFSGNAVSGHTHTRGTMNITGSINGQHSNDRTSFNSCDGAFVGSGNSRRPSNTGDGGSGRPTVVTLDASKNWTGATSSAGGHTPSGTVSVSNTGGSETRPKNIAWVYMIYIGK